MRVFFFNFKFLKVGLWFLAWCPKSTKFEENNNESREISTEATPMHCHCTSMPCTIGSKENSD